MPSLRRLGSREILRILAGLGFQAVRTRGGHAKLVRAAVSGERQVLTAPVHRALTAGLVHAIYRRAARLAPEADLRPFFFSE